MCFYISALNFFQESLAKKPKEHDENMSIPVEEFLTEARYNLLHWFDH